MNGIISVSASRSSNPPKMVTSVTIGLCLFSGFIAGLNVSTFSLTRLNPFHTSIIDFDKISWITKESVENFKLATVDSVEVTEEIVFVPYEMKTGKEKRFFFQSFQKPKVSNLIKLQRIVRLLQKPKPAVIAKVDLFKDFQNASFKIKQDFSLAAIGQTPVPHESIAMTSSSAATTVTTIRKNRNIESELIASLSDQEISRPYPRSKFSRPPKIVPPKRSAKLAAIETGFNDQADLNEVPLAATGVFARSLAKVTQAAPVQMSGVNTHSDAVIMPIPAPLLMAAMLPPDSKVLANKAKSVIGQKVNREIEVQPSRTELAEAGVPSFGGAARATGLEDFAHETTTAELPMIAAATASAELSKEEEKKLSSDLLNYQFMNQTKKSEAIIASNTTAPPIRRQVPMPDREVEEPSPVVDEAIHSKSALRPTDCSILANHDFIKPINSGTGEVNNQICPSQKVWVSKAQGNTGWVKLAGDQHLSTVTLHPAPNQGSTLLIDQNGLALIALKNGIHITKGMGIILGKAPSGYKVEFTGRAEETEYFETNGNSYFAILNVEPGAGVVELESKTNQNQNSTIFTPVLEDTVTYLDLAPPVLQNLPIKVIKNGTENDSEVMNLTVGISTQNGIQAITQANGQAMLKNVSLVPGYPVFIDVSSKSSEQIQSYTYRYQLRNRKKSGFFEVNQIAENSIRNWLKQVKQGLSDQGAMVVGHYDRKKLDGFKNHYFTKVQPLTAKFGLEPMNFSILWNGTLSSTEPLEGDAPRFMSVQVAEGLSQVQLVDESQKAIRTELLPISPRVIHVISE